jgi:hypothetical protein
MAERFEYKKHGKFHAALTRNHNPQVRHFEGYCEIYYLELHECQSKGGARLEPRQKLEISRARPINY